MSSHTLPFPRLIRLVALVLLIGGFSAAASAEPRIVSEKPLGSRFELSVPVGEAGAGKTLRVLGYKPSRYTPSSPVLIVLHGTTRKPGPYLTAWLARAEQYGALLLVPEFSKADWPGSRGYNLGNMRTMDGKALPREAWSFTAIETLFDAAKGLFKSDAQTYYLFGHSAGSQFVHRFMLLTGGPRVKAAVAANAGWYTMPRESERYPYGLGGFAYDKQALIKAFAHRLVILLGDADIDTAAKDLRRSPEAMAQGPHRLSRGKHFFDAAAAEAKRLGVPFAWELKTVRGIGHSGNGMAPAAARALLRKPD